MRLAKTCGHCSRTFTVTEAEMLPLSQVEKLLAQKEGFDWPLMVKVTCTECGTPSLTYRSELREVTETPAPSPAPVVAAPPPESRHCVCCSVELARGKYCEPCRKHRSQRPIASTLFWLGLVVLALLFLGFLGVVIAGEFDPKRVQWRALAVIVPLASALWASGWAWRRKIRRAADARGCRLDSVRASASHRSAEIAALFPRNASLLRDVSAAWGDKRALAIVAKEHGVDDDDALALSKHLKTEEKLYTRIQKDVALVKQCERSTNPVRFVAEANSLAILPGLDAILPLTRDFGPASMELMRQKAIADHGVNMSVVSSNVLLIVGGIYMSADDLLKNRREMFALLDRLPV